MRSGIGVGLLLALGLLTGCGERGGSSTPQTTPELKREKIIDKEGNERERITFPGPEGFQKRKNSGK